MDTLTARFLLRLPPELHAGLQAHAAEHDVSMNTLANALLADGLHAMRADGRRGSKTAP